MYEWKHRVVKTWCQLLETKLRYGYLKCDKYNNSTIRRHLRIIVMFIEAVSLPALLVATHLYCPVSLSLAEGIVRFEPSGNDLLGLFTWIQLICGVGLPVVLQDSLIVWFSK